MKHTTTQGEHAQTELAHELFAAAQLAPGEGIEDAVRRIAAALATTPVVPKVVLELPAGDTRTANVYWSEIRGETLHLCISVDPPAQPAAPQGVAYAELPESYQSSTLIVGNDGCTVTFHFGTGDEADVESWLSAVTERASNGQAPAAENELWRGRLLNEDIAWLEMFAPNTAVRSHIIDVLRGAMDGQAPAAPVTVEQVEDAIGLQSTAWDTIGAEKIVEAVLRLANGQAPAGAVLYPGCSHWGMRDTPATAQAAPAAGAVVGPGWKLVPFEPTPRMWTAGGAAIKSCGGHERDAASLAYAAMIATAPTPAAQADSVLEDAARWKWLTENCDGDDQDDFTNWLCATVADKASIDAKADEYIRHATRKQGAKHD